LAPTGSCGVPLGGAPKNVGVGPEQAASRRVIARTPKPTRSFR
jgi:hypothetical protein